MTQVALVVHPIKVPDPEALKEEVRKRCADAGWPEPLVVETTAEDPGTGVTRQVLADGARLVIAAGGDGTVRAVAEALALAGKDGAATGGAATDAADGDASGLVLGVVPHGTGNLLGRNLGVPSDPEEALDIVFTGRDRCIDVGRVTGADDHGEVFAVMAGLGLDAAMVRDAPEPLKNRVGWLAYLVGIARGLRNDRVRVTIEVDGERPVERSARAVLVGNVGELQGGVDVLPEASPTDGRLGVAILAARGPIEWLAVLVKAVLGRPPAPDDRRLERLRGRRIVVRARTRQAREVDGDLLPDGSELAVEVMPGALTVRVPADASKDKTDSAGTASSATASSATASSANAAAPIPAVASSTTPNRTSSTSSATSSDAPSGLGSETSSARSGATSDPGWGITPGTEPGHGHVAAPTRARRTDEESA